MNLSDIQSQLKAPKGQTNKFGGYKYRSCEDILEAVKPLLKQADMALILSDEIIDVQDRIYVKATAQLIHEDGKIVAETSAFAREAATKKGMDESQITGSSSSYARKYALNGLFAIDDTKDADTRDNREDKNPAKQQKTETITPEQVADIEALIEEVDADRSKFMQYLGVRYMNDIPTMKFDTAIKLLEAKRSK